jgi:hypothetical protein
MKISLSKHGDYYVPLNMEEFDCLVPNSKEYKIFSRKFIIKYKAKTVAVKQHQINTLCLDINDWKKLKTVVL